MTTIETTCDRHHNRTTTLTVNGVKKTAPVGIKEAVKLWRLDPPYRLPNHALLWILLGAALGCLFMFCVCLLF